MYSANIAYHIKLLPLLTNILNIYSLDCSEKSKMVGCDVQSLKNTFLDIVAT
jgi:hypothetical protein